MSHQVPSDRRYTKDHEWAKLDGQQILVGITSYAVDQLGDITMVNVDVDDGDEIEIGKPFGTVESVKTLADLFAPISGTVVRVNRTLEDEPELVNDDCYDKAWMMALEPTDSSALEGLLDADAYAALLAEEAG